MLGRGLLDFEAASPDAVVRLFFEKHRLINLDPDGWYPAQRWFDAVNDMRASGVVTPDYIRAGRQWANTLFSAPQYYGLPVRDMLLRLNHVYRAANRGTAIGAIAAEPWGTSRIRLTLRVPYPDDVWYGVCYGIMSRVAGLGITYRIYYDADAPRRDINGSDTTILHVQWTPPH